MVNRRTLFLSRTLVALLTVLLLVASLVSPAAAASTRPQFQHLQFSPAKVTAGQPVTITVMAGAQGSIVSAGEITLQSPSGKQVLVLKLTRKDGHLEVTYTMTDGAEPGVWKVQKLVLTNAKLESVTLRPFTTRREGWVQPVPGGPWQKGIITDEHFKYELMVEGSNPDFTVPQLTALQWEPPVVKAGEPVRITAEVTDDVGEVASLSVKVARLLPNSEQLWDHTVQLFQQPGGNWRGTFIAPVDDLNEGTVRMVGAELADKAGNHRSLGETALGGVAPGALTIQRAIVPPGLNTEPFLVNLIYPGAYSFLDWNAQDVTALGELWDMMETDPDGLRATVNWQVLNLADAARQLRKEIYTDPATKYRFVPLNTSGKWRAIDEAFQARVRLLAEADRRAGISEAIPIEKGNLLYQADIASDSTGYLTAIRPEQYADAGPALMASVVGAIRRSSLPAGLLSAPHKAPSYDGLTLLDRDLIWFQPFRHSSALAQHYSDGREVFLYLTATASPQPLIESLFHELGHHFEDAFADPMFLIPTAGWKDYLRLRKSNDWLPTGGWASTPFENLAEDWAYTFLPDDLNKQYRMRGSFQPLSEDEAMLSAFREWVGKFIGNQPEAPVRFDSPDRLIVGAKPITGMFAPGKKLTWFLTDDPDSLDRPESMGPGLKESVTQADGRFTLELSPHRLTLQYVVLTLEQEGIRTMSEGRFPRRTFERIIPVLPLPISPSDCIPRVVGKAEAPLFRMGAGGVVGIDGRNAFVPVVSLAPGENTFMVTTQSYGSSMDVQSFSMKVQVYREAAGEISLTAGAATTVTNPEVTVTGRTVPRALVRVGTAATAADKYGKYMLNVRDLTAGKQILEVVATSPGGNRAAQRVEVTYSEPVE